MKSGIYIIKNTINSKVYIGSAVNLKTRLKNHEYLLLKNKHGNIHLQNFVNKYGFDTLSFEILEEVKNKKNLIKREQIYIDSYKFKDLFNILQVAGSNLGFKHTESTKNKMSESAKGKKASAATRKKIGKSSKGRIVSEATRKKISESNKGRIFSPTTRKKMSESQFKTILIFKDKILVDTVISLAAVAKKYNLHMGNISKACCGKRNHTGGYTMKYERT